MPQAKTSRRFLSLNLRAALGDVRTEEFDGKTYVVVPVIPLREGVIFAINAPSPEFVPGSTLRKNTWAWDGRPAVLDHPMKDGEMISANSPEVLEAQCFGMMFHTYYKDGALGMEAWFDPEKAARVGQAALDYIECVTSDNCTGEVSVGAFVVVEEIEGTFDGQAYSAMWTDIDPDHVAFLPSGDTGACSVEMGCGAPRIAKRHAARGGDEAREWVAILDDKVCEFCEELDGQQVAMDEDFQSEDYHFYEPPAHNGCRCQAVLVPVGETLEAARSRRFEIKTKFGSVDAHKFQPPPTAARMRIAWEKDDATGQFTGPGGSSSGSSQQGDSARVTVSKETVESIPRHPNLQLADHPGFEGGAIPLNMEGSSTRSPCWTDDKPEVEEAFGDFGEAVRQGTEEEVSIDSLSTYQTFVSKYRMKEMTEKGIDYSKPTGVVMNFKGKDWLVDGNHRTSLAKLAGKQKVKVIRIKPVSERTRAARSRLRTLQFDSYEKSVLPADIQEWLDGLTLADESRAGKGGLMAKKQRSLRQKFADVLRTLGGNLTPDISDKDIAEGLVLALRKVEPRVAYIECVYSDRLIYATYNDSYDIEYWQRTYSQSDKTFSVADTRAGVELYEAWVPVDVQSTVTAARRRMEAIRTAVGARHSANDMALIQNVHDYATQLGAGCVDLKAANAHTCTSCGGKSPTAATTHQHEGGDDMTKAERILALLGHKHNPLKDKAALEAATEEGLKGLEAHVSSLDEKDAAEKKVADAAAAAEKKTADEEAARAAAAKPPVKQLSEEEYLANAPQSIRDLVTRNKATDAAQKAEYIRTLKGAQTEFKEEELQKMSTEELGRLMRLAAPSQVDFSVLGGASSRFASEPSKDDVYANPPDGYAAALKQKVN